MVRSMKKRNLSLILFFILVLLFFFKFFLVEAPIEEAKKSNDLVAKVSPKKAQLNLSKNKVGPATKSSSCLTVVKSQISETAVLWTNTHIQLPSGVVQRIRVFNEDGENGSFKKLVLFQEDEDGFPVKLKLEESISTNPSSELVESYRAKGKVIYDEVATSIVLNDGHEIFEKTIDGKVIEKYKEGPSGRTNCLTSNL